MAYSSFRVSAKDMTDYYLPRKENFDYMTQSINQNGYGQMDFNLPHDVVSLPSGGKYYISKKKSVKVGYLTAADENTLLNMNPNKTIKESIVLPLLRNKLYESDIRPEDLLDGDIEALLIFLRNTSFGPEYVVSVTDPQTNKEFFEYHHHYF